MKNNKPCIKKILVVDDDVRNIYALTATLKNKGFVCVSALDGSSAMEILANDDAIRMVLMDIMMPETDGYELLGKIRRNERFSKLALIAVTAQAMPGDREKCLQSGADDYISKPIDVDKMIAIVSHHLN